MKNYIHEVYIHAVISAEKLNELINSELDKTRTQSQNIDIVEITRGTSTQTGKRAVRKQYYFIMIYDTL